MKKSIFSNKILGAVSAVMICILYLLQTREEIKNIDYVAINGLFQNFNPIRRFLSGQHPAEDFTVYLGMGHLTLTSVLTWMLGGDFQASVLAYDYLSSLFVVVVCYALGRLYFPQNWGVPFLTALLHRYVTFWDFGLFTFSFQGVMTGGNSAKTIRALILPLTILLFLILWRENCHDLSKIVLISVLSGLALTYSNDYGVMVCFCSWIMVFLAVLHRRWRLKKLVSACLVMLAGNLVTVLLISAVLTGGHPLLWIQKNFISADFQSWYFNNPEERTFYLYELDTSKNAVFSLIGFLIYTALLIRSKADAPERQRFLVGAFLTLTCLGALTEYQLFSGGGYQDYSVTSYLLCCLLQMELFRCLSMLFQKINLHFLDKLELCSLSCIVVITGGLFGHFLFTPPQTKGEYVPELGGYLDSCLEDLQISRELTADGAVFSAYASALETVTGQFQASGTDYIIHCLSDDAREDYLRSFREGKFPYVSTIREDYAGFGLWIRNANWFFYREVYENYHKIGRNAYADYWAPGAEEICTQGITAELKQLSDTEWRISVHAPPHVNGLADVSVAYQAAVKQDRSSFLLYHHVVGVQTETEYPVYVGLDSWSLRPESAEYLPIDIRSGEGSVIVTSYPQKATSLVIHCVSCERIFTEDAP